MFPPWQSVYSPPSFSMLSTIISAAQIMYWSHNFSEYGLLAESSLGSPEQSPATHSLQAHNRLWATPLQEHLSARKEHCDCETLKVALANWLSRHFVSLAIPPQKSIVLQCRHLSVDVGTILHMIATGAFDCVAAEEHGHVHVQIHFDFDGISVTTLR